MTAESEKLGPLEELARGVCSGMREDFRHDKCSCCERIERFAIAAIEATEEHHTEYHGDTSPRTCIDRAFHLADIARRMKEQLK